MNELNEIKEKIESTTKLLEAIKKYCNKVDGCLYCPFSYDDGDCCVFANDPFGKPPYRWNINVKSRSEIDVKV